MVISRRKFVSTMLSTAVGAGTVLGAWPGAVSAAGQRGIVGSNAPPLQLDYWIGADGKRTHFDSSQWQGKWVYMKFFQNWCPGCHKYGFPALKKVSAAFADDERVMVMAVQTVFEGFSTNVEQSVRELQLRYELPILMGHDAGDPQQDRIPKTMRDYRSAGTPWVVIIDTAGQVVYNDYHINPEKFIAYLNAQISAT